MENVLPAYLHDSISRESRMLPITEEKCPHGWEVIVLDVRSPQISFYVQQPGLIHEANAGYVPSIKFIHIKLAHFHTQKWLVCPPPPIHLTKMPGGGGVQGKVSSVYAC